jgi:hypothetical protein
LELGVPVVDGFEMHPGVWIRAGDWIGEAVDALAHGPDGVDELCRVLGGEQPFGRDDLGRALLEGDPASGTVGFAGRRDYLLAVLAGAVNELRAMAARLPVSGAGYVRADDAIVEMLGGRPVSSTPRGSVANPAYVLPLTAGGSASTVPPPSLWLEAVWILEAVGMGCAYPDGDIEGVHRLVSAVSAARRVVEETAAGVETDAEWVIRSGWGETTAQFASTARGAYGRLTELAEGCEQLKRYLQQAADAIRRAQWQCLASAVFVMTLMRFGAILGGWVQLTVLPLVRLEGVWLRIVLRLIREAVLGGVFSGGLDVIGQLSHGTDLDWSELSGALWQGSLAGGLIGFAHGGLPALATRSPAFGALAGLMASSGAKGTVTRLAVGGGVGTAAMATAGWASGHGWDWKHAAEMGFGMAVVGAGGEVLGKAFRPAFKPENAPRLFQKPPELMADWRQQAAADLTWIRSVDPGIRKFLDQLAVRRPGDREPREYLAETRDLLRVIPRESRELNRPLVREATAAIARLLWQVDAMYGRTDGPHLHDGTYWRDTPYLYNNGDHTRDVIAGSLRYMTDVNAADRDAGRPVTYPLHKMVLSTLADAGHDVVQGHGRGVDERAAAAVTDAVARAYMPQTYTEAHGRYIYNSDRATTFNGKTKAQDVDPARGDLEGQWATAVGDLFHLNFTEKLSRGLDIAIQDFAKPAPDFYGPEFQRDMRSAGVDLRTATTVDYLTVLQRSEKWNARLIQFGEGQLRFLRDQRPPDPRVMQWYQGRERAIRVWTDLLQRVKEGEIDWVRLYYELQKFSWLS